MRYFNEVGSVVAGFHDGVRSRVIDTGMPDALVTQHEAMHARIFRETPDGQVHAAYCITLEEGHFSGRHKEAITASAIRFFEASRTAQESFATYLSVKLFYQEDEPEILKRLTPEYVGYFSILSDILDPLLKSTYLQFIAAWNLAVCVFSSPLVERFPRLNTTKIVALKDDEHPDGRLSALIEWLKNEDLTSLFQSSTRSRSAPATSMGYRASTSRTMRAGTSSRRSTKRSWP